MSRIESHQKIGYDRGPTSRNRGHRAGSRRTHMTSPWISDAELAKIRDRHDDIDQDNLEENDPQSTQEDE